MKIIRKKDTKVAYYIFNDGEWVTLTDILLTRTFKALDMNSTTHEIVSGEAPLLFSGGAMTYDNGVWTIVNQDAYDEAFGREKEKYKKRVKDKFTQLGNNVIVDTGLGFSVNGGRDNLRDFETGKKHNLPQIKDSDNNFHDATAEMYDTVIGAIELNGISTYQWKWAKEVEIDGCLDINQLNSVDI